MKQKLLNAMPFLLIPLVTPFYNILDSVLLVDVFGCGCVPSAQTNMLNIPFNANDLRLAVYLVLSVILSIWSFWWARSFQRKYVKWIYCAAVILYNLCLTLWVVKAFMWA